MSVRGGDLHQMRTGRLRHTRTAQEQLHKFFERFCRLKSRKTEQNQRSRNRNDIGANFTLPQGVR
jgi:hypothetical protein